MNDVFFKPSLGINSLINENSSIDLERFQLFLEAYYEWLQTATITLNTIVGTFVVDETIIGSNSGAIGKIIQITSTTLIVKIISERKVFDRYETITGQTSNATSTINLIKDNIVRASGNVLNYKNIETSIDKYVLYLKDELYPSLPATYYGDKRLIAKYFKDFFQSKGTEQSYRFLFRLLYDQEIEFYYPGQDILRVSDGNFEKTQVIRTNSIAFGYDSENNSYNRDIFLFLNKTIVGATTGSLANVVDIKKFFIGSTEVAEMTLKLVSGTFNAGEIISTTDDTNLFATIYGIVSGFNIIDGGSGYQVENPITITGDGYSAEAVVSSIKQSPINALKVNTIGHGYRLGTTAYVDNSGTGGSGLIVQVTELANTYTATIGANTYTLGEISKVSIINRGSNYYKNPSITLQDSLVSTAGLLTDKLISISNAGINYGVGNTLIFTGGSGTSAAGIVASVTESTTFDLLFEDGFQMKSDGGYYDIIKNEDWSVTGSIKRLELTNFGTGYTSSGLPTISVSTTTGANANLIITGIQGTSANVTVDSANNATGIGSIRSIRIKNFGVNYTSASANVLTVGDGNANLIPIVSGLGIKDGDWINDDGKIDYKIIQDSYYYQDYSYVIKSGLTFAEYSSTLKKIIHPAGLQLFGEIQILNNINVEAFVLSDVGRISSSVRQILYFLSVAVTDPAIPSSYGLLFYPTDTKDLTINVQDGKYSIIIANTFSGDVTKSAFITTIETPKSIANSEVYSSSINKFIIEHKTEISEDILYDDLQISVYDNSPISVIEEIEFDDIYAYGLNVINETTKYNKIVGTVSSANTTIANFTTSSFANTPISVISSIAFNQNESAIVGTGTTFLTDFAYGNRLLANNEIFSVFAVANNTTMLVDKFPTSSFSGVIAYKGVFV
jgi:hypothetical protein